jgi:hypothetical protein
MPPELELVILDRELSIAEEALCLARQWLKRSRGAGRARALAECEEIAADVARLEQRRLRLAGAELCLLPGGRNA